MRRPRMERTAAVTGVVIPAGNGSGRKAIGTARRARNVGVSRIPRGPALDVQQKLVEGAAKRCQLVADLKWYGRRPESRHKSISLEGPQCRGQHLRGDAKLSPELAVPPRTRGQFVNESRRPLLTEPCQRVPKEVLTHVSSPVARRERHSSTVRTCR